MKKSTKTFKCSDPSKNVYGMTVKTSGIRLDDFLNNPVCLLNHNYDKVLGDWDNVSIIGTTLSGTPRFDTEDPEADKIYGQVERDVIKGASIGIIPIKVEGTEIVESELLEISITPVPANRNALVLYNAKGVRLNAKEAKAYLLSVQKDTNTISQIMNPKLLAALAIASANAGLAIQLSADATDDQLADAVTGIGNKLSALQLSVNTLTTSNNAYKAAEDAAKVAEKSTVLNLAVTNKQITETEKEHYGKLYDADPELCKSTLEKLPKVDLSAQTIPGAQAAAEKQELSAEKSKWTFDDYAQKAPLELSAMETGNPDQFQKLYTAKVEALKAVGQIAQ